MRLAFIIPVRHQDNAKDWPGLKRRLQQTIASIANQTSDDWRAIIVCNHGADLPSLPSKFEVVRVDFPPNLFHDLTPDRDKHLVYDAFRLDKGRRVMAGMIHAKNCDFFMIVDDDDFVSNRIAQFVSKNNSRSGWQVKRGYIWTDGGRLVCINNNFSHYCGTSLILSRNVFDIPNDIRDAEDGYIKDMCGSHVAVVAKINATMPPLDSLPFAGAIYRVGHSGAHSQSGSLMSLVLNAQGPRRFVSALLRLRLITRKIRDEFKLPARSPELKFNAATQTAVAD